jgi:V/A-type H+/Na+-transporting ATPase subunit D
MMHAGGREIVPTHSMLLELAQEHRFVREGHDFLDQKRILLAGEILRRLSRYEALARSLDTALGAARSALARALARHGLSELGAHPAPTPDANAVAVTPEAFLGNALVEMRLAAEPAPPEKVPVNPSPEARSVTERFRHMVKIATELAGVKQSLQRLLEDYRRTERRTRALEDVILPELQTSLSAIEEHLEAQELEEAVRVRLRTIYSGGG